MPSFPLLIYLIRWSSVQTVKTPAASFFKNFRFCDAIYKVDFEVVLCKLCTRKVVSNTLTCKITLKIGSVWALLKTEVNKRCQFGLSSIHPSVVLSSIDPRMLFNVTLTEGKIISPNSMLHKLQLWLPLNHSKNNSWDTSAITDLPLVSIQIQMIHPRKCDSFH